jgi:hypothetical protein
MGKIQVWMRDDQFELALGCFDVVKEQLRLDTAYLNKEATKMAVHFTRIRLNELISLFNKSKRPNKATPLDGERHE